MMNRRLWRSRRRGFTAVALAAAVCGMAAVVSSAATTFENAGDLPSVTWNLGTQPLDLSVNAFGENNSSMQSLLCDKLLYLLPNGKTAPDLAEKITQPNPTTMVLTIRKGVRYWDGTPLTAADVAWNLNYTKEHVAGYAGQYGLVSSITATGANQVTIKFTAHDSVFLYNVGVQNSGAVYKPSSVTDGGANYGHPGGGLMCSGPFQLKSWTPGDSIVLTKNPSYWNPTYRSHIDTLTVKFVSDPNALASALISGEIDGAYNLSGSIVDQLRSAHGAGKLYGGKSLAFDSLYPTSTDPNAPLNNPQIRMAFALAVDRPAVARVAFGGQAAPNDMGYGSPAYFGDQASYFRAHLYKPLSRFLKPQVEQAKQLIAKAGTPSRPITLYVDSGNQTFVRAAAIIQQNEQAVGLKVSIMPTPTATLNALMFNTDTSVRKGVDLYLRESYTFVPDPENQVLAYQPGVTLAILTGNYSNPAFISASNKARAALTDADRAKFASRAIVKATNDLQVIPLVYKKSNLYVNKRLKGARLNYPYFGGPWASELSGK